MPSTEPRGQRAAFGGGADRLPAAAGKAARDRDRLRESEASVANEVIEFQLARQRVGLRAVEEVPALSTREKEVLALIVEGRSDGDIGERLYISKKTASVHVANIKAKLGASSRVEIAMLAARLGLAEPLGAAAGAEAQARHGRARAICPFKGLASYDVGDARFFFGRERLVATLVARLAGSTFVGVVGPSGSGKSSLVRAGLIPAIADGVLPGSDHWAVALLRPGSQPLAELRRAAYSALHREGHEPAGPGLENLLDALPHGTRFLLVVDQFEEAFTLCDDEAERSAFIDAVTSLARDPGSRSLVVVAVRADFYGRCAEHPELADLLGGNHVLIGPMTADELTRAIESPARAAGLRVEPELTARLVSEVRAEPGALPLLSTTLLDLWERRDGRTLRLQVHEQLGGIEAAVSRLAERAMARLTPEQRALARGIFLRLVTRAGGETPVRRPVDLAALDATESRDVAAVLEVLAEQRLVTIDRTSVEIAHETLIRAWPRLREWLDEDAATGRVREHLSRAALEWANIPATAELYRAGRLATALEWAADHAGELNQTERRFLAASEAAAELELDRQRASNRRLRGLLVGAGLLLIVALGAGAFAAAQLVRAEREADVAQARSLTASAIAALETDPALARLLALAAAEIDPSVETLAVLHEAQAADRVIDLYLAPAALSGGQLWLDIDRTAELLVASGTYAAPAAGLEVVDRLADEVLWSFPAGGPAVSVGPSFFSLDGRRVVAGVAMADNAEVGSAEIGVYAWDARSGAVIHRVDVGQCGGFVTDISQTHALVASFEPGELGRCGEPGDVARLSLVDLEAGTARDLAEQALAVDLDGPGALSADGRFVAYDDVSDGVGTLVVQELSSGDRVVAVPLEETAGFVRALSEDGSLLLVGDRPLAVHGVRDGVLEPVADFSGHAGEAYFAEFATTGTTVYSSGRDGTTRLWDAATGEELAIHRGTGGGRAGPAAEGTFIVVADVDAAVGEVIDTRAKGEVALVETCRALVVAASSLQVAGERLLLQETCDDDPDFNGVTTAIDLATWEVEYTTAGWEGQTLAASPDGLQFVRQDFDRLIVGPLVIRDAANGELVRELEGLCRWNLIDGQTGPRESAGACEAFPVTPFPIHVLSVRWSPDGSMIAATDHHDADGFVAVWRASDGALLYRALETGRPAFDATFTPDSKHLIVSSFGHGQLVRIDTTTWTAVATSTLTGSDPDDTERSLGRLWFAGFDDDSGALIAVGGFLGTSGGGSLHWLDPDRLSVTRTPVLDAHVGSPKSVARSEDGRFVATGASDGIVRVWDVSSGELVHEIRHAGLQAQGVAFTGPDELAILQDGGRLVVHTLEADALLNLVRGSLVRTFTAQECARFEIEVCPTLAELQQGDSR